MTNTYSTLLIFGTSHAGKSTLATRIGKDLGWPALSTDKMGRHPGRPWPSVRKQVAEFYSKLSEETIYWFLRVHHENMWPHLKDRISTASQSGSGCVIEGSALRPEFIAEMQLPRTLTVGLYASNAFLRQRMEAESLYSDQDEPTKQLIEKFIRRSLTDNDNIVEAATRYGLPLIDVSDPSFLGVEADRLVEKLRQ
ncbi:hypothetical protein K1718_21505 [Roseibium porphyridii]|uniref:Uncharacterized protein n=1 Tax=Roseibium porphyridii TaxID=2866279 RepID=A0ABY8F053_9HYPH|nr:MULTISPECIES: hypothetical protein [Stappiaceae]QFT33438.1 hypothetical protein FIV00_23300 [Labrenzia sp. THAF82]WFE88711.1 hypothetical protein K1718_21505 [Roseibium sp. KMA01]